MGLQVSSASNAIKQQLTKEAEKLREATEEVKPLVELATEGAKVVAEKTKEAAEATKEFVTDPDNFEKTAALGLTAALGVTTVVGVAVSDPGPSVMGGNDTSISASLECREVKPGNELKDVAPPSNSFSASLKNIQIRMEAVEEAVAPKEALSVDAMKDICQVQQSLSSAIKDGLGWQERETNKLAELESQVEQRYPFDPIPKEIRDGRDAIETGKKNLAKARDVLRDLKKVVAKDDDQDTRVNPKLRLEKFEQLEAKAASLHGKGDDWVKAVINLRDELAWLDNDLKYLKANPELGHEGLEKIHPDAYQMLVKEYDALLRAASPAWSQDNPADSSKPVEFTSMHKEVRKVVEKRGSFGDLKKVDAAYRATDAYQLRHVEDLVKGVYKRVVPNHQNGIHSGMELAKKLKAEGKNAQQIRSALEKQIRTTKEWRLQTRNENRDVWYFQQPNIWSCAPTSSMMALAAIGKVQPNMQTWETLKNQLGATPEWGLPGDGRIIERVLRDEYGVYTQFDSSKDVATMRKALEDGYGIIVNGAIKDRGGHFVYIGGIDDAGNYIMGDPFWETSVPRWTDADLWEFVNGPNGADGPNPPGFVKIALDPAQG